MIVHCLPYNLARDSPSRGTSRASKGTSEVKASLLLVQQTAYVQPTTEPNPKPLSHDYACQQRAERTTPHHDLTARKPSLPVAPPLLNAAVNTKSQPPALASSSAHVPCRQSLLCSTSSYFPNRPIENSAPRKEMGEVRNLPSASSQARPAPKPSPTNAGHALRLNSRTEKMTPKERPREDRTRKDEIAWSHCGFVLG